MKELLGSLLAGVLMAAAAILFTNYQKQGNLNMQVAATAQQATQLNTAVQSYITQYSSNISAVATSSTPATITVAMLQSPTVGLLPSSFSTTNPFGQTWQAQVLQPTAGNLNALVLGIGGTQLTDQVASRVAALIGAAGGFIPLNDSGTWPTGTATAQGAYAGWSLPTAGFTGIAGGNIASLLTFSNSQFVSNYLYRNNVGNPSLNTMTTPIILPATYVAHTSCTNNNALALDSNGNILTCQKGYWNGSAAIVDALLVAGGGGSGFFGGGGGGGVVPLAAQTLTPATAYAIIVGGGGAGNFFGPGQNGSNSSFNGSIAKGGGAGGYASNGQAGGSGGGAGDKASGGAGTVPQGNAGGSSAGGYPYAIGGGGAGAGEPGGSAIPNVTPGAGGNGITSSITGSVQYYAPGGPGASGGGGTGIYPINWGVYGSGGAAGGSGFSGVVIISYPAATPMATGGIITNYTVAGNVWQVHTFTSNGIFKTN